jgi:hypothetical protein
MDQTRAGLVPLKPIQQAINDASDANDDGANGDASRPPSSSTLSRPAPRR